MKDKLVFKGGTALNVFIIFAVPRLAVDIDLNYVGAVDRETMFLERLRLESFENLPLLSLRGAERRGNLFGYRMVMGLLRFARNDNRGIFQ
ncbi:MAG: nucleotidyl transferase AbiEii/AbiGii toxin family protein, partial [Syntrophales bacterium]